MCSSDLFETCSTPVLSSLTVRPSEPTSIAPQRFTECLQRFCQGAGRNRTFRHFIFDHSVTQVMPHTPSRSLIHLVRPLMALSHLETVHLSPMETWRVSSSDPEVEEMVMAWPRLLSLRIDLGISIAMPFNGTFRHFAPQYPQRAAHSCGLHARSLLAIAKACPKLRELTILCDLSEFTLPTLEDCPATPHPLQVIRLISMLQPDIAVESTERLAQFIDRLFPNIILDDMSLAKHWMFAGVLPDGVVSRLRDLQHARTGELYTSRAVSMSNTSSFAQQYLQMCLMSDLATRSLGIKLSSPRLFWSLMLSGLSNATHLRGHAG